MPSSKFNEYSKTDEQGNSLCFYSKKLSLQSTLSKTTRNLSLSYNVDLMILPKFIGALDLNGEGVGRRIGAFYQTYI